MQVTRTFDILEYVLKITRGKMQCAGNMEMIGLNSVRVSMPEM